ncbi:type I toxin-antitoxin system Fst family toxin [Staphylococcus aureus]|nr:type I toxin-antitoxin system Fst family toxin [Staphylococcus aureus]
MIIAPIIVECFVTLFKFWIEQHNKKQGDIANTKRTPNLRT